MMGENRGEEPPRIELRRGGQTEAGHLHLHKILGPISLLKKIWLPKKSHPARETMDVFKAGSV